MRTCILILIVSILVGGAAFAQEISSAEKLYKERLAARYDAAGWPGKGGTVAAGLRPEHFTGREEKPLIRDHDEWIDAGRETVLMRQYTNEERSLFVAVTVARSCDQAHGVFIDHLSRLRSMKPLDRPALPFGEVRLQGIGDVCFATPARKGYHTLEFVRNNIVVLMRADENATGRLASMARTIDRAIASRPTVRGWPAVERFSFPANQVRIGSMFPVDYKVSEGVDVSWVPSAGGIVEKEGKPHFYVEGEGKQTLTLRIADQDGLSSTATVQFEVID